ncbi:MAG: DEAD/DEAH box helicase [Candidatus Micrarchaeia archaeon]
MSEFARFNLRPEVLRALQEMGFEKPTDIQMEALPVVFQGKDVIGQAKTGTGKTAVFGIYLVETVEPDSREVQGLVLAPTRELAVQITDEIKRIGKHTRIKVTTIYGGASINPQIEELRRGVHIVVGTPGRILDHLERRTLDLSKVHFVVIDEADRMLDMGFIDDVRRILSHVSRERQTLLFSATMPPEILALSKEYQNYPQFISVSRDEITITHIRHSFVEINHRDRHRTLFAYLKKHAPTHTIIFCRTKFGADRLARDLRRIGFRAEALHGDLSQRQRDTAMSLFKQGKTNMLVATDLAARGLDIPEISHVINFNIPEDPLTYTHRVGRTGRMGKGGTAFSIIAHDEMGLLGQIERTCGIRMEEEKIELPPWQPREHAPRREGAAGERPRWERPHSERRGYGGRPHERREGGYGHRRQPHEREHKGRRFF